MNRISSDLTEIDYNSIDNAFPSKRFMRKFTKVMAILMVPAAIFVYIKESRPSKPIAKPVQQAIPLTSNSYPAGSLRYGFPVMEPTKPIDTIAAQPTKSTLKKKKHARKSAKPTVRYRRAAVVKWQTR